MGSAVDRQDTRRKRLGACDPDKSVDGRPGELQRQAGDKRLSAREAWTSGSLAEAEIARVIDLDRHPVADTRRELAAYQGPRPEAASGGHKINHGSDTLYAIGATRPLALIGFTQHADRHESRGLVVMVDRKVPTRFPNLLDHGMPQYARQFELKYSGNCLMTSGS
jgi:hypothetical protein